MKVKLRVRGMLVDFTVVGDCVSHGRHVTIGGTPVALIVRDDNRYVEQVVLSQVINVEILD